MSRWILAFMLTGTGLAAGSVATTSAFATDRTEKGEPRSQPGATQVNDNTAPDPAERIDKAIAAYEGRFDQELDQIRKEISRQRKELSELSELQLDLAVSLAELQAELRVMAASRNASSGDSSPGAAAAGAAADANRERQRIRCMELARELRSLQDTLRGLVQQKRNETDQIVLQLRNLRAQQRQMSAEAGRSAQAGKPSQD